MTDPNITLMKILGSIFIASLILGMATAGNKRAYRILFPVMVASGICLSVAQIWLFLP